MGHEVTLFGCIEGAFWRTGSHYRVLQDENLRVLASLPDHDEWPFLVRGMFAAPAPQPFGTYRTQAIHFGTTLKDDPADPAWLDLWISKFEAVLRRLHWLSATLWVRSELVGDRVFVWIPERAAGAIPGEAPPEPVSAWTRSVRVLRDQGG